VTREAKYPSINILIRPLAASLLSESSAITITGREKSSRFYGSCITYQPIAEVRSMTNMGQLCLAQGQQTEV